MIYQLDQCKPGKKKTLSTVKGKTRPGASVEQTLRLTPTPRTNGRKTFAKVLTRKLCLNQQIHRVIMSSEGGTTTSQPPPSAEAEAEEVCRPCDEAPPEGSSAASGAEASGASGSGSTAAGSMEGMPTVCIVIGMAGSGKTCLMQRINAYRHAKDKPPYIINLDPAVGLVG